MEIPEPAITRILRRAISSRRSCSKVAGMPAKHTKSPPPGEFNSVRGCDSETGGGGVAFRVRLRFNPSGARPGQRVVAKVFECSKRSDEPVEVDCTRITKPRPWRLPPRAARRAAQRDRRRRCRPGRASHDNDISGRSLTAVDTDHTDRLEKLPLRICVIRAIRGSFPGSVAAVFIGTVPSGSRRSPSVPGRPIRRLRPLHPARGRRLPNRKRHPELDSTPAAERAVPEWKSLPWPGRASGGELIVTRPIG